MSSNENELQGKIDSFLRRKAMKYPELSQLGITLSGHGASKPDEPITGRSWNGRTTR